MSPRFLGTRRIPEQVHGPVDHAPEALGAAEVFADPVAIPSAPQQQEQMPRPIAVLPDNDVLLPMEEPDTEELQRIVADGGDTEVFAALLPRPLDAVYLDVSGKGGELAVYGKLVFESKDACAATLGHLVKMIERRARDDGADVQDRGGFRIVQGPNGSRIGIGRGDTLRDNELHITNGDVRRGYNSTVDLLPKPEPTPENTRAAVRDVVGALAVAAGVTMAKNSITDVDPIRPRTSKQGAALTLGSGRSSSGSGSKELSKELSGDDALTFEDIAGHTEAKRILGGYARGIKDLSIYKRGGTRPPRGVLMYGPPGTGKTMLARATAGAAGIPFYAASAADLTSKWYGESEKRVKELFAEARQHEAAIVFLDEIDALTPDRNGAHEATQRIMSVFLQEMDGISNGGGVLVLAATNRRESLDGAMLRPGRFDRHIEIGLPDIPALHEAYTIHMRSAERMAGGRLFGDDVDIQALAQLSDGLGGSHVAEAVRSALEDRVLQELLTEEPQPLVSMAELQGRIAELRAIYAR